MARKIVALSFVSLAAFACGGSVYSTTDDGGGGGDGGSNVDSSVPPTDGGLSPKCPATAPSDGASCTSDGLECEYGSDPSPHCDTIAKCQGTHWQVQIPPPDSCNLPPPKSCPPSFQSVPVGQACPNEYPTVCPYPQGMCGCDIPSGPYPADAAAAAHWSCDAPAKGCPMPRPKLGSTCSQEGLECDYSVCTLPTGAAVICQSGTWHEQMVACAL